MKKILIIISIILVIVINFTYYHLSYNINSDFSNLETCINNWFRRGYDEKDYPSIKIYDNIEINNINFVSVEHNEELGIVFLKKSITDRYKIKQSSVGTSNFNYGIVDIKNKKYLVFEGRNINHKISKAKFDLDEEYVCDIDVPDKDIFLVYKEIDKDIDVHYRLNNKNIIKFYDNKEKDITSDIDMHSIGYIDL